MDLMAENDYEKLIPLIANSVFSNRIVSSSAAILAYLSQGRAHAVTSTSGIDRLAQILEQTFGQKFTRRTSGHADAGGAPVAHHGQIKDALRILRLDLANRNQHAKDKVGLLGIGLLIIHPLVDGNGRLARLVWCRGLLECGVPPLEVEKGLTLYYADNGYPAWQASRAAAFGNESTFLARWRWAFAN